MIGSVLVVDGDELVRRATCRVLTGLGYGVVPASGGAACREVVRARGDVTCVLMDLDLPDGPGETFADALRVLRPDLPVIFMTGRRDELPAAGALCKPFTVAVLEAALGQPSGPRARSAGSDEGALRM